MNLVLVIIINLGTFKLRSYKNITIDIKIFGINNLWQRKEFINTFTTRKWSLGREPLVLFIVE
jgi:hypothetical protein